MDSAPLLGYLTINYHHKPAMKRKQPVNYRGLILLAGIVVFLFYILGILFPETLWALHSPGLLPFPLKIAFFLITAILFSSPFWPKILSKNVLEQKLNSNIKNILFLAFSIIIAILFYQFPIFKDYYGDAIYIKQAMDIVIKDWDPRLIADFFKLDWLDTKVGLKTYYQINNFLSWFLGINAIEASRLSGAFMGGIFAFIWFKFTDLHLKMPGWKILFSIVGVSAPFVAVFMGHFESYSLSYTGILIWMTALSIYFKTHSKKWLIALPFIFLFILQTHITNWLLFPSLLIAYIWHFKDQLYNGLLRKPESWIQKFIPSYHGILSWKGLMIYCIIPIAIIGIIAYFIIYANHDGPRQFSTDEFENTLFLPLYTDEPAPYDRYNLLSLNHLSDYFNLMFMWGGAILLLLIPPLTFLRKKIPWNHPLILASGLSVLLFFSAFFFLNPLLGSATDWDLFATPGIIVLPFLVFVYVHLENHLKLKHIAGPVLGLCLLGTSFLIVNSSPKLLSEHLRHIGSHNFKTYWIGCSTVLIGSSEMVGGITEQQDRLERYIEDLQPYAVSGNDKEYSNLLLRQGINFRTIDDGNDTAISYFERAYLYSPLLGRNVYYLTITHFESDNFTESFKYATELVAMKYPPYQKTLKIAVHVSLAAKQYQSAADYAVTYLNHWQDDETISEIEKRLRTGDRVESLIDLFDKN